MFVVGQKVNDSMIIGDNLIRVTVVRIERNQVRLGFEAPASISILRAEVYEAKRQEQEAKKLEKSEESAIGTITGRDRPDLPMHSASGAGTAAAPPRPAYEPKINDLFDNDTATRVKSARAFGYYHAQSPAVAALNALQAALRQEEDPSLQVVFAKAIESIAGKSFLENLLKTIKNEESLKVEHETTVSELPPKEESVKALFTDLPGEHDSRVSELEAVNQAYRQEFANQFAQTLNPRIQAMPHDTYDEKKDLARQVNEELRRFDLAIKGPTGQPSVLIAVPGHPPNEDVGRMLLEYKSPEGKRSRTQLPPELPIFELMDAAPRREALREWRGKVGDPPGDASRA